MFVFFGCLQDGFFILVEEWETDFRVLQCNQLDKGHCKILYEGGAELEIADFYDFSSTYPDEAKPVPADGEDEEAVEDGEEGGEWEDVDEDDEELGDLSQAAGYVFFPPS